MSGFPARGSAFIQAEPNPIPEAMAPGTTTLTWSTGSEALGWVYVTDGAGEERLFAHMAEGEQEARWIAAGVLYRFTLYADEDRTRPLASVDVATEQREPSQSTMSPLPSSETAQPSIRAEPNPVPAREGMGTTTISWSTGDGSLGWVYTNDADGDERLFAKSADSSQLAAWITAVETHRFTLYGDEERLRPLASVSVEMEPGQLEPRHGGRPEGSWLLLAGDELSVSRRAPTTLLPFDMHANHVVTERIQAAPRLARHFRGGSQVLPIDDGHLCLIHESVNFGSGGRVYLHRWVWFDRKWRLTKMSLPFVFQGPSIEFAGGLARRGNELVLSYGVRDRETWLATVDVSDVLALLVKPLDAKAEMRAMHAEAAHHPAALARTTETELPKSELEPDGLEAAWWEPSFQMTVDAYDRGHFREGLEACERLLTVDALPLGLETQTRRNAVFYAPSLAEITSSFATWSIDFPIPTGWSRFNPSVAADRDGNLRMVVRSSNYEHLPGKHQTIVHDEQGVTRTTNYLLDFDASLNIESVRAIDDHAFRTEPPPRGTTGFEDCRLISRDRSWWISATVWDHSPGGKAQMALLRLEDDAVAELHLLSDGITRHEKNWMPVQPLGDGAIRFIYSCFPTVILKFDERLRQSIPSLSSTVYEVPAQ